MIYQAKFSDTEGMILLLGFFTTEEKAVARIQEHVANLQLEDWYWKGCSLIDVSESQAHVGDYMDVFYLVRDDILQEVEVGVLPDFLEASGFYTIAAYPTDEAIIEELS